jgi:hypothetical protein
MKKGTTRIVKNAGYKINVRDSANNATFTLYLPYSSANGFSIGNIRFNSMGGYFAPSEPLPKSWYVNLNA